jgi:chromate transporter
MRKINIGFLLRIFWVFCKIGPTTFGGGYVIIPLVEKEVSERRQWMNKRELADIFTMAGSAPGAVAVNTAIMVGHRLGKIAGAVAAMLGMVLPTVCIMIALSLFFFQLQDNQVIEAAFQGLRAGTVALIVYAGYKMWNTSILDKSTMVLFAVSVLLLFFFEVHPVFLIGGGALAGMVIIKAKGEAREKDSQTIGNQKRAESAIARKKRQVVK